MQSSAAQELYSQEQDLASRAREGDQQALSKLYQRYQPLLLRHAWRMLGDEASAVDVVQEAYAKAIVAMPRTQPGRLLFRPWIFRIATNLCLRELTRRARCSPHELNEELVAANPASAEEGSPDGRHRRRELGPLIERALARLPDRYRQILLLRELDGLSYEQLGEVLEINKATVKVTLHRARSRFAALLLADQLLANPHASVACAALEVLLAEGQRRGIERHLEDCDRCRRPEQRPARELLALLPAVPQLTTQLTAPLPELSQAAGSTASSAGVGAAAPAAAAVVGGVSGLAWVGGAAAVCVAVAAISLAGSASSSPAALRRPADQPSPAVASAAKPTTAGTPVTGKLVTGKPATPASAEHADDTSRTRYASTAALPISSGPISTGASRSGAAPRAPIQRAALTTRRQVLRRGAAVRARRSSAERQPVQQAADPEEPPAREASPSKAPPPIKLKLTPGTAWRRRGARSSAVTPRARLAAGDRLLTRGGSLALLLPGHQWLTLDGAMTLISVPTEANRRAKVVVKLTRGVLRLSANRRGGGLLVRHGQRACRVDHGEARLATTRRGSLRVEAIDGYVRVSGPHASRTVTPGAGAVLDQRPGFAHALLPPPRRLRPTSHRGSRAPELRWAAVPGARAYRVLIGGDADFLVPEERVTITGTRYRPRLATAGKHFWKVVPLATASGVQGSPSKVYSFDLDPR